MSIIIFSRPIHTGKTTELMQWCNQQKNVAGILMPDINGKRNVWDIKTQQSFIIECNGFLSTKEKLQNIGSYYFYDKIFGKANTVLTKALLSKSNWLVIDEIGKLELMKKGFYPSLKKILESKLYNNIEKNLLLVVRNILLIEVISFFKIENYTLKNKMDT